MEKASFDSHDLRNIERLGIDAVKISSMRSSFSEVQSNRMLSGGGQQASSTNPASHLRLLRSSVRSSSAADFLKTPQSSEARAIDKMFEDLSQYEQTLARLSNVQLNDQFRNDLESAEIWFSSLSECERLAVVYAFLPFLNPMQKRFISTVVDQQLEAENAFLPKTNLYAASTEDPLSFSATRNRFLNRHSFTESTNDSSKVIASPSIGFSPEKSKESLYKSSSFTSGLFAPLPLRPSLSPVDSFISSASSSQGSFIPRSTTPVQGYSTSATSPSRVESVSSYANAASKSNILFSKLSSTNSSSHSSPKDYDYRSKSPLYSVLTPLSGAKSFDKSDSSDAKKPESLNMELLDDISSWLKSHRLHKYTGIFANVHWKQMIEMSDSELEARGVLALGARRKLLKIFEQIKEKINA